MKPALYSATLINTTLLRQKAAILALVSSAIIANPRGSGAQQTAESRADAPRIGLVLGGGGAKGLAHIGVLQILHEENISPSIVTGTSMGALVGGLYAIGHTPAGLDSIVTSLDWISYFRDVPERRFLSPGRRLGSDRTVLSLPIHDWKVTLPSGTISGQRISELLANLTWSVQAERDFSRLPRSFAAIATDIETGRTVVLNSGSLAETMRASMSIPSLFSPVVVDGMLLVDGGVTRNLPAREAKDLGADIIICSDVTDTLRPASRLRSLLDILMQTVSIYMNAVSEADRPLCDIYIHPETEDLTIADFAAARTWITRGRDAAGRVRGELAALRARSQSEYVAPLAPSNPARISGVRVEGVTGPAERVVRRRLELPGEGQVSAGELEAAVQRAYATQMFESVTYRLEQAGPDTLAVITALPRQEDRLGLGIRHDDTYNVSVLLTGHLGNRLGFGSTTELELRLGEQLRAAFQHSTPELGASPVVASGGISFTRTPVPFYSGRRQTSESRLEVSNALASLGVLVGAAGSIGTHLKLEHARTTESVAAIDSTTSVTFTSIAAHLRWETLDRSGFPTRGTRLTVKSERALSGADFSHHVAIGLIALPLAPRFTLVGRAAAGKSSNADDLPLHYVFMLGGLYPAPLYPGTQIAFAGFRPQQVKGTSVSVAGAALQWKAFGEVYAITRVDVGYAGTPLSLDSRLYHVGAGIALGALTPFGPAELSLSGRK
ncbi:MAG: patatin-like phospholipase family protein, partial [Gemmatimonadaceae bacterium]